VCERNHRRAQCKDYKGGVAGESSTRNVADASAYSEHVTVRSISVSSSTQQTDNPDFFQKIITGDNRRCFLHNL
jgi:hypothetical protein